MAKKIGFQELDSNRNPTGTWRRFSTAQHTFTATGTWEAVTVPDFAAEVFLKSDYAFSLGESATATGAEITIIQIGITGMETIYLKGTATKTVEIVWGLL